MTKSYRSWVKGLLYPVFALLVGAILVLGLVRLLPAPPLLEGLSESRIVTDRTGQWLTVTLNDEGQYRRFVGGKAISPELKAATLHYEDQYFYDHPGVNPASLLRAAWASLWGRPIGASTITMQVARLRLGLDTRTISGKLSQIFWALRFEAHYDKDTILATYLNLAPYGGNVEGVEAASRLYFGKAASALTLQEAVSLSVVPQNPVKRAPLNGPDFFNSRNRALDLAQSKGALSQAFSFVAKADTTRPEWHWPFLEPHVTRFVLNGTSDSWLQTTIDANFSDEVRGYLEQALADLPAPSPNGAVMVMDARTGEVLVHVGSRNFFDAASHGQVDGLLAKRSPGSTLKPFIYSEALTKGLIHSESLVLDTPLTHTGWTPENADHEFLGPMRAAPALALSRNLPAVRLLEATDLSLYDVLKTAGVTDLKDKDHYGLSMALGTTEVTPVTLVRLYSALVNGGLIREPVYLKGHTPTTPPIRLMTPEVAWITRHMLLTPTGVEDAFDENTPNDNIVYFKTGTSHGRRDAWTVGTVGPYVVAVWMGHFTGNAHPALQGPSTAAPLFLTLAQRLRHHPRFLDIFAQWTDTRPKGVSTVSVCDETGDVSVDAEGLLRCTRTRLAYVIPGLSPNTLTGYFVKRPFDKETGKEVCVRTPGVTEDKYVLEWPDFLAPFVSRPQRPDCSQEMTSAATQTLEWVSPLPQQRFLTGTASESTAQVIGKVKTTTPTTVAWFDGGRFLGHFPTNEPVVLTLKPGPHKLIIQGKDGTSLTRTIHVLRP